MEQTTKVIEKQLCEYCYNNLLCSGCKYFEVCKAFRKEKISIIPSNYINMKKQYIGKNPNRIWEIKDDIIKEKEKNNMLPKNVKITNKIEENTVYVNDCTKYPIKSDEEYVCIFDGNVINNNFINVNVYGIIIDINENNVVIYNEENKNISIIDRKSIKCLLPKENYDLLRDRD